MNVRRIARTSDHGLVSRNTPRRPTGFPRNERVGVDGRSFQRLVVDEPGRPEANGERGERRPVDVAELLEGPSVGY